jgi:energy-coupling factor transport system ATP-binding protein
MATLAICGLYPFRKWPVSALSYGQKKRLTIASIWVMGPSLILLDEPIAGQDFRHYGESMEFLRKLNREQGMSFLFITHDMHLMLEYTQRVLVLADGKFLVNDTPAAILTDHQMVEASSGLLSMIWLSGRVLRIPRVLSGTLLIMNEYSGRLP